MADKKLIATIVHKGETAKMTMMTKQKKKKTQEAKEEDDSNTASLMEMFHCV